MRKCGIITYHFANNYGAVLQCFALKKALESLGCDSNILNYISDKQLDNNSLYRKKQGIGGFIKNICLLPFAKGRALRDKRFQDFRLHYLKCNERLNSINSLHSLVETDRYDVIVSGSDQVWNPNVYDFDEAFFFPFKSNAKKVGYGISLGNASEEQLDKFSKWINDFDIITVREKSSIKRLKNITKNNIFEVIDPVFLVDPTLWENITNKIETKPYILCYFVRKEDIGQKIKKAANLAKNKGLDLKIVNLRITKYNLFHDIIFNAGPIEFLSLMMNAKYIYTDSFHGTAFSIIFNKNFTVIESAQEKKDNRKRNLLSKFGLENRIKEVSESDKILSEIDYHDVKNLLSSLRASSLNDLKTMIS